MTADRTFQTRSGARYLGLGPTFAIAEGVHAFQVASDHGEAVLVELPESMSVESLRAREQRCRAEPHVLSALVIGMLADTGGASPYRGSAHDAPHGFALFPARPVRTLAPALTRARAGERFAPRVVTALAVECARGLAATEDLELFTPASVLIDAEGTARVRGPALEALVARMRARDDAGAPRWLGYRAPELLRTGATSTAAARQFALGVMLFELLAGRALFPGSGAAAAQQLARWSVSVSDTAELGMEAPTELRSLVWSLLQREPDRRASARMIVDLLGPLYEPDFAAGAVLAPDAGLTPMFAL